MGEVLQKEEWSRVIKMKYSHATFEALVRLGYFSGLTQQKQLSPHVSHQETNTTWTFQTIHKPMEYCPISSANSKWEIQKGG